MNPKHSVEDVELILPYAEGGSHVFYGKVPSE